MLNALRFEQTLRQITTERFEVMVQEAVSAVEQGLTSIVVHICGGEILLRSYPDRSLATLEPARLASGRASRRRIDPSGVTLGRRAKDSSGECAAGMVVIFDAEGQKQLMARTVLALSHGGQSVFTQFKFLETGSCHQQRWPYQLLLPVPAVPGLPD